MSSNLSIGFGKSLLYRVLPLVFDLTSRGHCLTTDMSHKDRVSNLKELGLKAATISSFEDGERIRVETGEYSLVYGSPVGARWCLW